MRAGDKKYQRAFSGNGTVNKKATARKATGSRKGIYQVNLYRIYID